MAHQDPALQLQPTNKLYKQVSWICQKVSYDKLSYALLQAENQRILSTLKVIQNKINGELEGKKKLGSSRIAKSENFLALQEKIKNNQKLIASLRSDCQQAQKRRSLINEGLESKTIETKFILERTITKTRAQIKQLKLQQQETAKLLSSHADLDKPQNHDQHLRMQQQLRVMSIKYVRLLDKYNKTTEKLAISSNVDTNDIEIPQDLYDRELQQRQQAQYKEYEGIVKLCTVLSHRNDSEHNKAHREYMAKLKELERTVAKLGQLDRAITNKQGQLMESKKNVQLFKYRMVNTEEDVESKAMRLSQGSMPISSRRNSLTNLSKLKTALNNNQKYRTVEQASKVVESKLRNRGYSLTKIK